MNPKDDIIQNLKDAGCSSSVIDEFFKLEKNKERKQQIKLLLKYRNGLLDTLHDSQIKIDCLDFLIYKLREN